MKAAVVQSFQTPPKLDEFSEPSPLEGEAVVSVKAAALTQLVRAQAAGKFYGGVQPPFVPGADGVGLLDGQRVYFAFPRAPFGSMAERALVRREYCLPVPVDLDDVTAAAAANPGMAAWAGLTRRAALKPGESVLVLGANGVSGRLAIQVARHLGAGRVLAAARSRESEAELRALGADELVPLEQPEAELSAAFRRRLEQDGVDVVLDFVFGKPAEAFISACTGRATGSAAPRLRFVQVGTLAAPTITLPGAALRSSGLELLGSGLGASSHRELVTCIAEFFAVYARAGFCVETRSLPLEQVTGAWNLPGRERLVLVM